MEIRDLSLNESINKRHNSRLLPYSIRGLIVGKSGCGKTTLLLNLLLRPGWLDYGKLYVFGKSLFQPEYRILKKALEENLPKEAITWLFDNREEIQKLPWSPSSLIEEMAKNEREKSDIDCEFYETSHDVPDPRDLSCCGNNLINFDDLMLEKQNKCESYYIRGRHSNVDCFYLCQNYFILPRQTIRENSNFMLLFKQDMKNINHIYDDHVRNDMSRDEFRYLCKEAWKTPHGFVVIDLTSNNGNGKYEYRRGLVIRRVLHTVTCRGLVLSNRPGSWRERDIIISFRGDLDSTGSCSQIVRIFSTV